MNKTKFLQFIDLYHLGGLISAARLSIVDNVLSTSFIADDKSMAGEVSLTKFTFADSEFGINDTANLKTMIKPLNEEVTMEFTESKGKKVAVSFTNPDDSGAFYTLAELSVIPTTPKIKVPTDFDVEIVVDAAFITRFIQSKSALPDVETFTLMMNKKDKLELVIGWTPSINTNRQTVTVKTVPGKDKVTDPLNFNANHFKAILAQNSGSSSEAILRVSSKGLAIITFTTDLGGDKFVSTYYLIQKKL